ncbi:amidase [Paracoccus sp. (in: a-proteobacteria)]|uniref:amidase n=1 Tax=Paracoccus sp. TaxID=267 RepID=UPI002AFE52BD|nr:amidase [Paracoccus sp. (in: a-proteobacteria)]
MSKADAQLLSSDLTAQAALLASGALSSRELVQQQLLAIAASQPVINSYLQVDAEAALAAAAESDRRRRNGVAGPLEGLPVAVKDNIDVAGTVTTAGMETRRHSAPAAADNPAVAALRAAGAVIVGKLNMHEAAMGADNDNPFYGACHNPHRPGYTPGGSSGGSGAAVAAGLCSAALGTDTMGSVRIPASYCGVVGLKPSWGALSTRGTVALCRRLDHVGPLTRSARDLGVLLQVMAGFDPDCAQSRAIHFAPVQDGPLRIGVVDFGTAAAVAADVQGAFEEGLRVLSSLSHRLQPLPAPQFSSGQARRAGLLMCEAEMLVEHAEAWAGDRSRFSPLLVKLMSWAEGRSAADLAAASQLADRAQVQLQQWLAQCDVLVMPTAPQRAFAFGTPVPASQADLTAYANMAGNPALSLPLPVAAGELPAGMQLVGAIGTEKTLIALAEAFQQAVAWQPALPEACAAWWPR